MVKNYTKKYGSCFLANAIIFLNFMLLPKVAVCFLVTPLSFTGDNSFGDNNNNLFTSRSILISATNSRIVASRRMTGCCNTLKMALGDYTLELEKPLGIILEELEEGRGVYVKEVAPDGAAAKSRQIVPRDVLLQVNDIDVSKMDFDSVMDIFMSSSSSTTTASSSSGSSSSSSMSTNTVRITLGDGLGMMNMPKNVVNQLKSQEDAFFIDAVVRQAVREIRRDGRLGELLKVEVIVGAGVRRQQSTSRNNNKDIDNTVRGMVRFFSIFSTDGVSTYSCNVSATGVKNINDDENNNIKIINLSCAKDEGLGQTFDLIRENVEK